MKSVVQFEGVLNGELRGNLISVLNAVEAPEISKAELKKLCGVALEMLDNAQRYANGMITFKWDLLDHGYTIQVVNNASPEDALRLIAAVNRANALDTVQLKATLLQDLTNGEFGVKGGAGMGLMQIAYRTNGTLEANIEQIEHTLYRCESTFNLKRECPPYLSYLPRLRLL